MFSLLGILDRLMMPVNYRTAWFLRFAVIIPMMFLGFLLTFTPLYLKFRKAIVLILLIISQFCMLAMIYISIPEEPAFAHYYIGVVVIVLNAGLLFRESVKPAVIFFIGSFLAYLIMLLFKYFFLEAFSDPSVLSYIIGNSLMFLLIGCLSLLGISRLRKSRDEAKYANQVKTSFLANISHEIRTPLNGITGCARLLAEPDTTEVNRRRYEEIIEYCSKQLMEIVDSILLMSEIETSNSELKLEPVSLFKTCEDLVKQFAFIAEQKNLKFEYECLIPEEQEIFTTDIQKFRMIISNLLNNAIKFTNSGTVYVRGGFLTDELRVVVEDTGIGIPESQLENIFDSFYQTDRGYSREFGGNGLGLAICKSYVEMLKGSIKVESTPGKGSTFTVTFPSLS